MGVVKRHRYCHDELERRKWQNPEAILLDIGLQSGFTFADIGCGEGFFALPAAKIVGQAGRVFAMDADHDAIARLKTNAAQERLSNLTTQVGEAEETVLCESCADIVFFGIVLHDFKNPSSVLTNAKTMLKPHGRLIDLDWKKRRMELGPPLEIRFSEEDAVRLIESARFKIETVKDAGPYHYVIAAKPQA